MAAGGGPGLVSALLVWLEFQLQEKQDKRTREASPKLVKLEKTMPKRPKNAKAANSLDEDIEANLLKPWPRSAPLDKVPMHMGGLMHGLVAVAREKWASSWPQHCCIMSGSMAEATRQLQAQPTAQLILCILQTEHHWGLLAARRAHKEFLVFDGKPSSDMDSAASSFAQHARELGWGDAEAVWVDVPDQTDDWSCGIRAVTAAAAVVAAFDCDGCSWPPRLLEHDFSEAKVRSVAASLQAAFGAPAPDGNLKIVKAKQEPPDLRSDSEPCEPVTPKKASRRPRSVTPPVEKELQQKGKKARQHSKAQSKASQASTQKQREEQARKEGARLAREAGVTHNKAFQIKHHSNLDDNPSGHWQQFCQKLGAKAPMKCSSCRQLREVILSASQKRNEELVPAGDADASATGRSVCALVPADAADAADGAQGGELAAAAAPAISRGRGRPKKGAEPATLKAWVQKHRPGVYSHVVGNTWNCVRCNKEIHCRRATESGNHYLYEHEESMTHKRLHDQTGEVELVQQPCEGVLLGQGQVPQLDKFSDSILKCIAAGQLNFASSPKTDPLNLVAVVWRENDLLLKHCQCLGMRGAKAPACETCLHLAQSRALHTQICKWAWRIDMASYGRALAMDPQEARAAVREALMNADYRDIQEVRRERDDVLSGKDEAGV